MKKFLVFLTMFLVVSVSCQKSDNQTFTDLELLTSGCWVLTGKVCSPAKMINGVAVNDLYSVMPLCLKDDAITFSGSNGFLDRKTKCSNELPVVIFDFMLVGTSILFDIPNEIVSGNLISITENSMNIESMESGFKIVRTYRNTY